MCSDFGHTNDVDFVYKHLSLSLISLVNNLLVISIDGQDMTSMRQLMTFCRVRHAMAIARKLRKHSIVRHLSQRQQSALSAKVTTDSDITHNRNALRIIETAIGCKFNEELLPSIEDKTAAKVYFDFITICPEFYSTEKHRINRLKKVLPKLSDNHVIQVLKSISLWRIKDFFGEPIVRKVVNSVDNELTFRFKMRADSGCQVLDNDLFVAHLFFGLKAAKICGFNRQLIQWLSDRNVCLTKDQLLGFLFCVNVVVDVDHKTKNYVVCETERHIDDMTVEEMSVVCMTFYKIALKFNDNLMRKVLQKSLWSISSATNDFAKTDILKAIRLSYNFVYKREVQSLVERFKQLAEDNDIYSLVQLVSLLSKAKLYDKQIFDQTFALVSENTDQIRDKYISRLLSSATEANHRLEPKTLILLSQHISSNVFKFEHYLCQIVSHFCWFKHYPKDLIEFCFDRRFLSGVEAIEAIDRDFDHLQDSQTSALKANSCLSIEKFDHFSHLLLDEKRVKRFRLKSLVNQKFYSTSESNKRQTIEELFQRLRHRLPKASLHLSYVMPFDVQPIVVILNGDCHRLAANLDEFVLREGLYENCIALNVLHLTDYSDDRWTRLTATASLRNRLLDRLGFRVISLRHKTCAQMLDSRVEFECFVRSLI